jgi:TolA-binding protein
MTIEIGIAALASAGIAVPAALKLRGLFAHARREKAGFDHLEFLLNESRKEIIFLRQENGQLREEVAELKHGMAEMGAALTMMQATLERATNAELTQKALEAARNSVRRKKRGAHERAQGDNS